MSSGSCPYRPLRVERVLRVPTAPPLAPALAPSFPASRLTLTTLSTLINYISTEKLGCCRLLRQRNRLAGMQRGEAARVGARRRGALPYPVQVRPAYAL